MKPNFEENINSAHTHNDNTVHEEAHDEMKEDISIKDAKEALKILNAHGKVYHHFIAMAAYFFILILLLLCGIIPDWLVPVMILPVLGAIFVLKNKYENKKK